MWVDPNRHAIRNYMFEWADPADGGICEDLAKYNGNTRTASEVHYVSPGVLGTGTEKHCIRPGIYWIRLHSGSPTGPVEREFLIDYLGGSQTTINDNTQGVDQYAGEILSNSRVFDFIVHFDLAGHTPGTTAVLDLQNAGTNRLNTTFQNNVGVVSGNETQYFRAGVAGTQTNWARHDKGRFLAKIYWDTLRPGSQLATNYYSPRHNDQWLLRTMQYGDSVATSRTVPVRLAVRRPDDELISETIVTRPIELTRLNPAAPIAHLALESASTWQNTDQYLTIGNSDRGSNIRYSWSLNNGATWSPNSADTIYHFFGHAASGTHSLGLKVTNLTTGLSTQSMRSIDVSTGSVILSGQQSIAVKQSYTYTSNIVGEWFERRVTTPQTWQWSRLTAAGSTSSTLNVIWPAGCYETDMRQQDTAATKLKRGRRNINVHTTACGVELNSMDGEYGDTASSEVLIFGAGPVISSGTAS